MSYKELVVLYFIRLAQPSNAGFGRVVVLHS